MGLLLLRTSVAVAAMLLGWNSGLLLEIVSVVCVASLLAGLITPLASIVVALDALYVAIATGKWVFAPVVVVALALLLLGPGAFSIDARLFGRREIIIPRRRS